MTWSTVGLVAGGAALVLAGGVVGLGWYAWRRISGAAAAAGLMFRR